MTVVRLYVQEVVRQAFAERESGKKTPAAPKVRAAECYGCGVMLLYC